MVRINLLPIRGILRKREIKQFAIAAGIAFGLAALIMGGTWAFYDFKLADLQTDKKKHEQRLNALKKKNKEITALKNRIKRLKKQVVTIKKLTKTRDTPAPFMAALAKAIPSEVWIHQLNKKGKSFRISGTGSDNIVVVNFVERLQTLKKNYRTEEPYIDPADKNKEPTFFRGVKLLHIMRGGGRRGLGSTNFTITGRMR